MPVIFTWGRLKQADQVLKASLGCLQRLGQRKKIGGRKKK